MKYFLIAGEASGDLHASNLMAEIKNEDRLAEFQFLGGDLMLEQGGTCLKHYSEMAYMGIIPVLMNLNKINDNLSLCKKAILNFEPNVVILVDYPGFNLRIAEFAKNEGIKTAYYISPKIWAWKTRRIHKIKEYVDRMYTIFPFETDFYKKYNYKVEYVGNPVFDSIQNTPNPWKTKEEFEKEKQLSNKPIIALLAGSRKDEIKRLLPEMLSVVDNFKEYQFIIAGAPNIDLEFYKQYNASNIPVIYNHTYNILRFSKAAIVASGTATLETAILKIPQVVVYKLAMGWLMSKLKPYVIKTKFFSLVNLVGEREIVKELFHKEVNQETISEELNKILHSSNTQQNMLTGYDEIGKKLKTNGASKVAASKLINWLKS